MKKPDEIKKGLDTCIGKCTGNKPHCPYHECGDGCMDRMNIDALAYIQQLEAEKKQLLEDLADHCGSKTLCKKYEDGTCPHEYDCTLYLSTCEDYEWRGLPEV